MRPGDEDDDLLPPRRLTPGCLLALIVSALGLIIVSVMVCQVLGVVLSDVAPTQP